MKNLTLIIPAKNEEISLPRVLEEIKKYKCKKIIILSKKDRKTFDAISNFKCKIIKQKIDGYGAALIEGIHNVQTKYLCIFNADGSFDPKYLNQMLKYANKNYDFNIDTEFYGANLVPQVGDIIMFQEGYFEVDNVVNNQLFVGKDPDYPNSVNPLNPGLQNFGWDISILCKTHYVPQDRVNITKARL